MLFCLSDCGNGSCCKQAPRVCLCLRIKTFAKPLKASRSALDQKNFSGERCVCVSLLSPACVRHQPSRINGESERDPAVLARCSVDYAVPLVVPLQKLYPWCCGNSRTSCCGKLWLFILFIYFLCPEGRANGYRNGKDGE